MTAGVSGTDQGRVDLPSVLEAGQAVLGPAVEAATAEVETVSAIARKAAEAVAAGQRVFAVGAGHAQAFAMELCHRAGGLPWVVDMNLEDLRSEKRDVRSTGRLPAERDPANGPLCSTTTPLARRHCPHRLKLRAQRRHR